MVSLSKPVFIAAALLLALPAGACKPSSSENTEQADRHGGRMGHMSAEQRLMWREDMRNQMRGVPKEQRRAMRDKLRDDWKAMDPAQRTARLADLQKQWDALPADQQQKLKDQQERRKQAHMDRKASKDQDSTE